MKIGRLAAIALSSAALLPSPAAAQAQPPGEQWQFTGAIYGYLPTISGKTTFPVPSGGSSFTVEPQKIVPALQGVFMGSLGAHNGRWGAFTDVIYLNIGGSKSGTRDFSIGNIGIPAGTSADMNFDTKGLIWTLAGQYRVLTDQAWTVDLLGGARMVDLEQKLRWTISGNLGPLAPPGRSGSSEINQTSWDAIIGVKGRYRFGAEREWSVPFYLDVGTGQSDSTKQAAIGVAYAFGWGELAALWRYLDYDMKSGKQIQSINLNGPMIGAAWHW